MLNILCDNSFLLAYGMGRPVVDGTIVQEVIRDMDGGFSPSASAEVAESALLSAYTDDFRQPFFWRVRAWMDGVWLRGPFRSEAKRREKRDDDTV
jgi:hypothetical protein